MTEQVTAFLATTGIPVGSIIAFAGEKNRIPKGWLPCEGQLISKVNYPKLFDAIGTVWGGTGTPNFYLPDLRGMFLRGVSADTNNDPDKDHRQSPQSAHSPGNPGNNGNNVGSIQAYQVQSHTHAATATVNRQLMLGSNNTRDADEGDQKFNADPSFGSLSVSVSIDNTGGAETRPINSYVYYIIKADEQQQ